MPQFVQAAMMAAFGTGEGEGMGSYATIRIGKHTLIEYKNTYHKWFFTDEDRKREVEDPNHVGLGGDFIGYRAKASTIRRRLQLAGYDQSSLLRDFTDTRSLWMRELNDSLVFESNYDFKDPIKETKYLLSNFIKNEHEIINKYYKIDNWIKKLPHALEPKNLTLDTSDQFTVKVKNEPLISFMLSHVFGISPERMGFGGAFFPCMQMESYALVLLCLCKDDDICELDITDVVHAGWVDDFEDIEQVQCGETVFYRIFKGALQELQGIELDEATPVLQRMIFSSVITIMEAYLSDTLKKNVLNRDAIKRRYVKNSESLRRAKSISLNDIFDEFEKLDKKIIEDIDSTSFHNVKVAIGLYKNVLLCNFPEDKIGKLEEKVETRHNIVHRNGKTTEGSLVHISKTDVQEVIDLVCDIVSHIDKQILDGLLDTGNEKNQ
ncbi:HEPN/Toprim-associated domain-containing protein [Aeromonas caviae]|uniref:HEPN/Toprim-associated domain-containing protein n=1 Tax=Aeromonas caviae TaxID=648 RepID=UPI002B49013B|nr:HEPN/Toprim-associated domain-containing protein [Aeromonas caviae]